MYKGNAAFIGFPCVNGNGVYIRTDNLYVNSSSTNQEGVKKFIEFILSDNIQLYSAIEYKTGNTYFPVDLNILENAINYYKKETDMTCLMNNVSYRIGGLTEETAMSIQSLITEALPYQEDEVLMNIIEEEMGAYFSGQKTAEEVAAIMDNRLQLYFDEQK